MTHITDDDRRALPDVDHAHSDPAAFTCWERRFRSHAWGPWSEYDRHGLFTIETGLILARDGSPLEVRDEPSEYLEPVK